MSPRNTMTGAAAARRHILDRGVAVASVEGLRAMSIARLADEVGMSKAGLIGPFKSKETLQLSILQRAAELITEIMLEPASAAAPGRARLRALTEGWIRYIAAEPERFPGGCLFTTATFEYDALDGPVHDAILNGMTLWRTYLADATREAAELGELPEGADPGQLAFELMGLFTGFNMAVHLFRDGDAEERLWRGVERLLGV
ncbi:TetR/AcrR family transcriptional regulator [Actinoplanes sp. TBRC 11911]|uniref:TetR/AcrR family transcriptional regulator n=1 Tax=Actinoplanes sp. TBRC 11911 TaxID=2729386 RepID=UPI00145E2F7C|nr:TetR/AcrR family transcriptional regulator [Actinoplanes sp. TBRC 11911]NMO51496.1 TetR/AcrR family transcriptional regulator [Actinoplanes sp. TBRC 11911]